MQIELIPFGQGTALVVCVLEMFLDSAAKLGKRVVELNQVCAVIL
jgi:hypothetical protein